MAREKRSFTTYKITYGIASSSTVDFKDYCRIDFYKRSEKVGQILMGSGIAPGSNGSIHMGEIHLYFPLSHFANIFQLLNMPTSKLPALYLDINETTDDPDYGGLVANE